MSRESPAHRPVPVVRAIIRNEQGQVLFLRRANTAYGESAWCLPGGKVGYGETVEGAIIKEVREETRLECSGTQFLFHQDSLPPEPGSMHCINLYFDCQVKGELEINAESDDWAWIGPSELGDYRIVFRNDEAVKRYWSMDVE